jgi:hypothetical protein
MNNHNETTNTEYQIDGITYTVTAHTSETATDTLHQKVEKMLIRDLRNISLNSTLDPDTNSPNKSGGVGGSAAEQSA